MTSSNDCPEILIVAAEASSALYAQRLLEYWQSQERKVNAFGIGSRDMEKLGFHIIGRSEELAVVGLQEVIKHWGDIKGAFHGLLAAAAERKPKVALLLDYPDFNLRLAKKLKAMGIRVVYYISPQVWAWRQSRVKVIRNVVDKMLVLFPFEVDFYRSHQVDVEFVGHPLLDELQPKLFDPDERARARSRYGVQTDDLVLGLMPGSRRSELSHHIQVQIAAARKLRCEFPKLKVMILVAPTFSLEEFRALIPPIDFPYVLIKGEPFTMIGLPDVILCASGTATLMVGLMRQPMVIMYRMNAFTAWIAKRFVRSTAFFGLINLVIGRKVVEELFQEAAEVDGLCQALRPLLSDQSRREKIKAELAEASQKLGERGATVRVARAIEEIWSAC